MGARDDIAVVRKREVLGGRYRVEKVLGEGGMGVVVAARHVDLGQRVAVKFMLPRRESSQGSRERFLREARLAVKLRSQHVARVTDVGTFARGDQGEESPYIVMEYLDGCDLDEVLEKRWPIPVEDAIEYLLHACEAVGEAHAHGIVHRDLKPANLFLTKNPDGSPCVKVLDFGISKLTSEAQFGGGSLTKSNAAMGTPHYMSPEQMRSAKTVDSRSDIWSLGVIAYELLTRRVPFDGESVTELTVSVIENRVPPMHEHRDDVPQKLGDVVLKCLQKDPSDRWQNVADLARALAPFGPERAAPYSERVSKVMEEAESSQGDREAEGAVSKGPGSITGAVWGGSGKRSESNNRVLFAAGAMAVVAVVVGFLVGSSAPSDQPTPAADYQAQSASVETVPSAQTTAALTKSPRPVESGKADARAPGFDSSSEVPKARPTATPPRAVQSPGINASAVATAPASASAPSRSELCTVSPKILDEDNHWVVRPECR